MCRSALPALLLLAALLATVRGDTVAEKATAAALDRVCGSLGGYYVTPGHCVSALCSDASDPCRATRDDPAVAALAARLAVQNATTAQGSIQAAANATLGGEAEAARSSCLQLYAGAVPALRWAAASVASGRFRGAREVLQAAQYVAAGFEGVTEGIPAATAPLPPENERFRDRAFVAHAVVAYMANTAWDVM